MTYWEYKASLDKYGTYTRGQVMDAYETAEYATINRVLEIINEIEHDMGHTALIGNDNKFAGVLCNSSEFRDRVLALKGGEYEDAGNDSCRWASD